jgi:aspartate racemase
VSLFQSATIEHLANILRQEAGSISWPTFIEIQAGDRVPPLFCVSTPNVNALGYRSLARYLDPEQPVYGLQAQYPEDLDGEHSQKAVDDLATDYLEALRAVQPKGPYQFVGMCRGAHIAYEMARRLEAKGEKVAFVGILDTWVIENTYNWFLYVRYYYRRFKSLLRLSTTEKIQLLKRKLAGASSPQSLANLASSSLQHRNPLHIYFPGPEFVPRTYDGKLTVFRVRRQPLDRIRDKELGWGKLAAGGVDVHYVSGTHGTPVLSEPHVQVLAEEMKKYLQS